MFVRFVLLAIFGAAALLPAVVLDAHAAAAAKPRRATPLLRLHRDARLTRDEARPEAPRRSLPKR
jgi:hypothetical protein